jgi:predicted DNA-binding protein (MmcQ/YjbR family)
MAGAMITGYNAGMRKGDPVLAKVRAICLALPDTKETPTWGSPHFRVGDKIFAGYGAHAGKVTIGFKLTKPHADAVIHDPRFERAPYVGRYGWVSLDATAAIDWDSVREMIHESYSLIASPASVAKLARASGARGARRGKAKTKAKAARQPAKPVRSQPAKRRPAKRRPGSA